MCLYVNQAVRVNLILINENDDDDDDDDDDDEAVRVEIKVFFSVQPKMRCKTVAMDKMNLYVSYCCRYYCKRYLHFRIYAALV